MAPQSSASSDAAKPLTERLLKTAKTLQFAWFIAHVMTLLGSFLYVLSYVTSSTGIVAYKLAYAGALVSYSIVVYKKYGIPKLNTEFAQKLLLDENAQYLILAMFWFFSKPIEVTLIPYTIYSVFHAISYVRTSLIDTVSPAAAGQEAWQKKTKDQIKSWTDKNYGGAMYLAAHAEVTIIMVRLLLGLFKLRIMPIFLFAQFLRLRNHMSTYTRTSFTNLSAQLDRLLLPPTADPRIPPSVSRVYETVKRQVIKYGQATSQPQPAPQR